MKKKLERQKTKARAYIVKRQLSNPKGLAVHKDKLYYLDSNHESIYMMSLDNTSHIVTLKKNIALLTDLVLYRDRTKTGKIYTCTVKCFIFADVKIGLIHWVLISLSDKL